MLSVIASFFLNPPALNSELYIIIVAIAAFLTLALGIILFVILYQRRVINHQVQLSELNRQKEEELLHASIRSEEEERMRIATELHDDVGATLATVRLYLHQALRRPEDATLSEQTKGLLDTGIQKVRDLSQQLQPGTLQYLGLVKALHSLADVIQSSGTVQMEVVQDCEWPALNPQMSLSLYRIIQELVTNSIRHSGVSWIRLQLHFSNNRYCISMSHNGQGLTATAYEEQLYKKGSLGLKNIELRLKSTGITIIFPEQADANYTATLLLPDTTLTS